MTAVKIHWYALIVFVNIICVANCSSQEANIQKIDKIRKWYNEVNTNIDKYKKISNDDINVYKDLNEKKYSFEGSEIYRLAIVNMVRFYSNGKLVKAIVEFGGDREELTSEYYFIEEELVFVFKKSIRYEMPKWDKKFDSKKRSVLEDRFYFSNNKLIKWIDADKKIRNISDTESKIKENQILSDSNLYKEIEP